MHTHTHTCIYLYIYIHTHTHTHAHTGMKDPQGRTVGADNYSTCVQLALLVLDAHIKKCNVFDIDDDECTQVCSKIGTALAVKKVWYM